MKSKLILGLLSLFMVFSMTSCMEKVDAGYEGIKVNLYGSDKGRELSVGAANLWSQISSDHCRITCIWAGSHNL